MIILMTLFFPLVSSSGQLTSYEKGQLAGSLGFGAMAIDAYYEICYSSGVRTDNNFDGINKLLKEKWGISNSKIMAEQEERTGRNYRQEAHNLVNTVIKQTGGCNSVGMEIWFRQVLQEMHENNLDKFHAAQ